MWMYYKYWTSAKTVFCFVNLYTNSLLWSTNGSIIKQTYQDLHVVRTVSFLLQLPVYIPAIIYFLFRIVAHPSTSLNLINLLRYEMSTFTSCILLLSKKSETVTFMEHCIRSPSHHHHVPFKAWASWPVPKLNLIGPACYRASNDSLSTFSVIQSLLHISVPGHS